MDEQKQSREQRRFQRFFVDGMAIKAKTISVSDIEILDISIGGVSVSASRRLDMGSRYTLQFTYSGMEVKARTEVMWAKLSGSMKNDDGDIVPIYTAGLRFSDQQQAGNLEEVFDFIRRTAKDSISRMSELRIRLEGFEGSLVQTENGSHYQVRKLSLGGMLVESDIELRPSSLHAMELHIAGQQAPISFTGRVASCYKAPGSTEGHFYVGVEFLGLSTEHMERLKGFVRKLIALNRAIEAD